MPVGMPAAARHGETQANSNSWLRSGNVILTLVVEMLYSVVLD